MLNEEKTVFQNLNDNLLSEAYNKALELNLDKDFLTILKSEIKRRELKKSINFSMVDKICKDIKKRDVKIEESGLVVSSGV